ncbi:MAG: ribulose-phosphate 3-epimerase [Coriobacteriales bacterium]|nr:ribulose-phosphate 3-epimerase [Coriobacteriales bacterium]
MKQDVRISPSILAADFLHLGDELESIQNADCIHYDVMDGDFVPNISFGPGILRTVKKGTDLPVDVHMMVSNPDEVFEDYLDAGADILTFHFETAKHPHRIIDQIHRHGAKAGIAVNPGTSMESLDAILDYLDLVLVMSVDPGFSGQKFIDGTYRQLEHLTRICNNHGVSPVIEVDGGVSVANAEFLVARGARLLVAGSSVFGAPDHAAAVEAIREAGLKGLGKKA